MKKRSADGEIEGTPEEIVEYERLKRERNAQNEGQQVPKKPEVLKGAPFNPFNPLPAFPDPLPGLCRLCGMYGCNGTAHIWFTPTSTTSAQQIKWFWQNKQNTPESPGSD